MSKVRDYKAARIEEMRMDSLRKNHENKDVQLISAYTNFLNTGEYEVNSYFEMYTEPFLELGGFFDIRNEKDRDAYRDRLSRYVIQMWRILTEDVTDPDLKSLNSFGDRRDAKKYIEGYDGDLMIRTKAMFKHPGFFKTYKKPLKEAAWFAVHSYVTDYFLDADKICDLIPKYKKLFAPWNTYIRMMDDVPVEVQDMFIIDPNTKTCPFANSMGR